MQADYAVELGREDDALEMPWCAPDGSCRYLDLRSSPELLLEITEACENQELGKFLGVMNSGRCALETAKCDTWTTQEMSAEEQFFDASWKYGCYVDLIFSDQEKQLEFEWHEHTVKELCRMLSGVPDFAAAMEFVVRRCYFHRNDRLEDSEGGFCITAYVYGYGDDAAEAKLRWNIAINLLQHALIQLTVERAK